MKVLIVEDDDFKFKNVNQELIFLVDDIHVERAASVAEAVYLVQSHFFDLIVLDMSLPSHRILPGKGPAASLLTGGMEIVYELAYMERLDPVIILTQYPELDLDDKRLPLSKAKQYIIENTKVSLKSCILYDAKVGSWKDHIKKALQE